jgi:hypothetical protein
MFVQPSEGAAAMLTAGLQASGAGPSAPGGIAPGLTAERGHPVFNLDLNRIAAGADMTAAHQTGVRYLLQDDRGTAVAAAELRTDASGAPVQFDHINAGPYVAATADALSQAQTQLRDQDVSYEVRLLRIPALYTMALWLAAPGQENADRIIPLAPAPHYLEPGRAYTTADFLAALREPAQSRLAVHERLYPSASS